MLDAAELEGPVERAVDPFGDRQRLLLVGELLDQDPELVAAEAGDGVAGAEVRAQPRRDRPQQLVALVVAEAVVDQLEVVEVEEEDAHGGSGVLGAGQRLVKGVDELGAVGKAGEGVVEDPVAKLVVGEAALDRVGEDVGGGLDEVDVLGGEVVGLGRVHVEDPEGILVAVDDHREAGADPEHPQRRRHREAALGLPVVDDHMKSGLDRGSGVGVSGRRGPALPVLAHRFEAGAQAQGPPALGQLPDTGVLDALDLGHQAGGRVHQGRRLGARERLLPQPRDRRLLGGAALEALLGDLALGDVVEHPVPDGDALGVQFEHRLVEDPDHVPVASQHAVVERRRVAGPDDLLGLLLQRPLGVLGMDPAGPQPRVGEPLLGGVAEDLLDLGADVAPAPVLAELSGVDDRRQPLDQDAVVLLGPLAHPRLVLGALAQLALLGAAVEQAHRNLKGVRHLPQQPDFLAAEHLRPRARDEQRAVAVAADRHRDRVTAPGARQLEEPGSVGGDRQQRRLGDLVLAESGPGLDPLRDDRRAVGGEGRGDLLGGDA